MKHWQQLRRRFAARVTINIHVMYTWKHCISEDTCITPPNNEHTMDTEQQYQWAIERLRHCIRDIDARTHNTYLHLLYRRQFAHAVAARFSHSEERFRTELAPLIKHIRLEAWTKQLLPYRSGIIRSAHAKGHQYTNLDDFWECSIEPRTYMALSPDDCYDTDGPSLVTALTPPRYTQPIHAHAESDEVTFYAHAARVIYQRGAQRITLDVPPLSVVRIPNRVYHTIQNITDTPALNASIKIPQALRDRMEDHPEDSPMDAVAHLVEATEEGAMHRWQISHHGAPYDIVAGTIDTHQEATLFTDIHEDAMAYVIDGDGVVEFHNASCVTPNATVAAGDHIVIQSGAHMTIRAITPLTVYGVMRKAETV